MIKKTTKTVFVTDSGLEFETFEAAITHEVGVVFERWYLNEASQLCDDRAVPHYIVFNWLVSNKDDVVSFMKKLTESS